jgi:hypothetical protein
MSLMDKALMIVAGILIVIAIVFVFFVSAGIAALVFDKFMRWLIK